MSQTVRSTGRVINRRAMAVPTRFVVLLALTLVACQRGSTHAYEGDTAPLRVEAGGHVVLLYPQTVELEIGYFYAGSRAEHLEFEWEQIAGPGDVTFDSFDTTHTTASFSKPGMYLLRLNASDGQSRAYGDVTVQSVAPEAAYFISTDGNDENDGRSIDTAFRSLSRAARAVRAGDTVLLRGGVYYEYNVANVWTVDGEPGRPITFTSYPGEAAIIDGSEQPRLPGSRNPSAPELVRLLGREWYVFENLIFRHSSGRGLSLEGNHLVARNITSHSNHGDGIYVDGDYNLIEHSLVFDNYSTSNGGDSADGLKVNAGTGNVIRHVVSYANSDDGFDLWATHDTLIEYSIAHHNGRGPTGNGNGFKLSSEGIDSNSIVRFNVSHSNRLHNFTDNGGGSLLVYNNTSWAAGAFGYVFRGRTGRQVSQLVNNISFEDGAGVLLDIQFPGGVAPILKTNSWDLGITNPLFISTEPLEEGFLKLSEDSPAIDVGTDMAFAFAGSAIDLGAFEYSTDYLE